MYLSFKASNSKKKKAFAWDVKILFDYFSHKGETDQLSDRKP